MKRTFPVMWPEGQPHDEHPAQGTPANCKVATISAAALRVEAAMRLPAFSDVELSANIPIGARGGYLQERQARGSYAGVVLSFTFQGRRYHAGQDYWENAAFNAWSLALMAEGLRQVVRHAGDALFERMISGLAALPAPSTLPAVVTRPAHEVLGVAPDAPLELIEAAFRVAARKAHPDAEGGSRLAYEALVSARDQMKGARS